MAGFKAASLVTYFVTYIVTYIVTYTAIMAMDSCDTRSAVCLFDGQLQGHILFQEKHGFGCNNLDLDQGLQVDIDLAGLDGGDRVTSHEFKVKSYAGLSPSCSGMGPDFGDHHRASDLGRHEEGSGGVVHARSVSLQQGPSLWGDNSILGRSVAVIKGSGDAYHHSPPEILGCCIIGMVNTQPPDVTSDVTPDVTARLHDPHTDFTHHPAPILDTRHASDSFPPQPGTSGRSTGLGALPGGRLSGGASPAFASSSFRSPFDLDSKMSFFDLTGKTSRVQSFSPDSMQHKFRAPDPPRFQDVYGLDSGESPLRGSGYGDTVRPARGSPMSQLFFQDNDVQGALSLGLTAEEMDIPRESGEEETSRSYHQDSDFDTDPADHDPDYDEDVTSQSYQGDNAMNSDSVNSDSDTEMTSQSYQDDDVMNSDHVYDEEVTSQSNRDDSTMTSDPGYDEAVTSGTDVGGGQTDVDHASSSSSLPPSPPHSLSGGDTAVDVEDQ